VFVVRLGGDERRRFVVVGAAVFVMLSRRAEKPCVVRLATAGRQASVVTVRGGRRGGASLAVFVMLGRRALRIPNWHLVLLGGAKLQREQTMARRRHVAGGNQAAHHQRCKEQRQVERLSAPVSCDAGHEAEQYIGARLADAQNEQFYPPMTPSGRRNPASRAAKGAPG
jgi:hypothetical protein